MTSPSVPVDFPRDTVGLCMIVKNEARALGRCLASVRPWVGEMVIVDTGSTDATVEIARSYGARVSPFPWCDDFSAARNAALDHATCEWVLVLDGDETLVVDRPLDFAEALKQSKCDGFSVQIRSLNDDGTHSQASVFRLFRRSLPGMRYRGEIHEQLQAVAAGKVRTSGLSCVRLDHDGYTAAVVASGDKAARNIRLAHKVTQSRPDDPFSWFVYAMAIAPSDPDGMLLAAQKAFDLIHSGPARAASEHYVLNLYLAVINLHQSRGHIAGVIEMAEQALVSFPHSADLLYQRGGARLASADFLGAIEDFTAALGSAASAFSLNVDPAATGHGARTGLAKALHSLGRGEEAIAALRIAVSEAPASYAHAHAELGALLLERGALDQATPLLEEAYRRGPQTPGVALKLGWCCYKLARFDRAEHLLSDLPHEPHTDLLLARVWLDSGKAEQALALLGGSALTAALLVVGWAQFVSGNPDAAARAWDAWLVQIPGTNDSRQALTLFRQLLAGESIAAQFSQTVGEPPRELDTWILLLLRYRLSEQLEQVVRAGPLLGDRMWPGLRMRWAQAMVIEGYLDAGMALLFDAARANPDDGAAYYWLGYCAMLRQQPDDARVLFAECLRCDPNHPQARQALALVN